MKTTDGAAARGKAGRPRRGRGFALTGALLRDRLREAGAGRGFSVLRLLTHWPEIVGPEIAAAAQPLRVSHGRGKGGLGGTLTLLVPGARAPLVAMHRDVIRERVNACYGYNAIARVAITQTAASGFAEAQAAFAGPGGRADPPEPAPDPAVSPAPATAKSAADLAASISDPDLRAAIEMLGRRVLSRP